MARAKVVGPFEISLRRAAYPNGPCGDKVTLQRLYTIEISAENELEACANANLFVSGPRASEFQPQVSEPRSKPIQSLEAIDDEWCVVEVVVMGPDGHGPRR